MRVRIGILAIGMLAGVCAGRAEWRAPGLFVGISVWAPAGVLEPQATDVVEVVITGIKNVNPDAVRAIMRLKPGEPFTDTQLINDSQAIQGLGLFQNVLPHAEPLPNGVRVVIDVVENEVVKEIRFTGDVGQLPLLKSQDLRKVMTLQPGNVLNNNTLRTDVGNVRKYVDKLGYFTQIDSAEMSSADKGVLEIKLIAMKVADVELQGLHATKPKVVRREMRTKVGEFFNVETWRKDMLRVYNLGFFDDIQPGEPTSPTLDTIALPLKFKERRTGAVNVGASYGDRSQLTGFLRVEESNLFGLGQSAYISTSRSNASNGFSVEVGYSNPWIDGKHTGLSVSLYDKIIYRFSSTFFGGVSDPNATDQYNERRTGGAISLSRPSGENLSLFTSFRGENVQTNNVATVSGDQFIQQDGSIVSLSFGGVANTRDLDVDPATGHYYKVTTEIGQANITNVGGIFPDPNLLGRHGFVKLVGDFRFYFSPEGRREKPDQQKHVWALRLYGGTVTGTIPFFEQYFAGGADSVRGYPEDRFWGKNVAFGNLEYRVPLQKAMTMVVFADYGDAWGGYGTVNAFDQSSKFSGQLGYGVGLHFRTPLGPIRLDFAFNKDGNNRTHFMIGHTF